MENGQRREKKGQVEHTSNHHCWIVYPLFNIMIIAVWFECWETVKTSLTHKKTSTTGGERRWIWWRKVINSCDNNWSWMEGKKRERKAIIIKWMKNLGWQFQWIGLCVWWSANSQSECVACENILHHHHHRLTLNIQQRHQRDDDRPKKHTQFWFILDNWTFHFFLSILSPFLSKKWSNMFDVLTLTGRRVRCFVLLEVF